MPKSRRRKKASQPALQIQSVRPVPVSPNEVGPSQDLASPSDGEVVSDQVDLSGLSFRQQSALPIIAAAPSLSRAAGAAGVGEGTLRRWLREPLFADRLATFRQQSAIIAREELNAIARHGMSVLAEAMADPNPAIRIRAARYALSYTVQFVEIQNMSATLDQVKQLLSQSKLDQNGGK